MGFGGHLRFEGYPPILPGVLVALALATLLCGWVARRLRMELAIAWLLLAIVGVILAITMTPSREALAVGTAGGIACDLSRIGPAPLAVYLHFDDPILNVLMFIPLGVLIGLLDPRQHRRGLLVAAVLLPFAIEATQAVAVPLGRACQGGDVFDNLAGLGLGLVIGLAVGGAWRSGQGPRG